MNHPELEVAVLGPVEVRDALQPFHRSASKELVVYLAFHRRGVRNDQWAEALWPSRTVSLSTVHSTASDARRSLGVSAGGHAHLPRSGRRLRLEDTVVTDVERFARLASFDDPDRWKDAIGLIRGPLFDGLKLADWAVFDGTHAQVESMVVATALKGAENFLRRGSGSDAEWMIRRALWVSPYDERLHRALFRATEAQGNRIGLRTAMAQLLALAAEQPFGWADGAAQGGAHSSIHPQTMSLYRELVQGGAPAARGYPVRL